MNYEIVSHYMGRSQVVAEEVIATCSELWAVKIAKAMNATADANTTYSIRKVEA